MDPIANLNIVLEKELEMECQGFRRTRRWIGDASQVKDSRWYQAKESRIARPQEDIDEINWMAEAQPCRDDRPSTFARFFDTLFTRRQSAKIEV